MGTTFVRHVTRVSTSHQPAISRWQGVPAQHRLLMPTQSSAHLTQALLLSDVAMIMEVASHQTIVRQRLMKLQSQSARQKGAGCAPRARSTKRRALDVALTMHEVGHRARPQVHEPYAFISVTDCMCCGPACLHMGHWPYVAWLKELSMTAH